MEKNLLNRWTLLALALLGLTLTLPAQAVSLYKWVDENGRVHYSQTPPEASSAQSEQMQLKDSNPYQSQQQEEAKAEQNENTPTTTDEAANVVELRKKNCEIAKQNLAAFKNSDRVQQEDGTVIKLSDEMRATKVKEAQALVNAYCN